MVRQCVRQLVDDPQLSGHLGLSPGSYISQRLFLFSPQVYLKLLPSCLLFSGSKVRVSAGDCPQLDTVLAILKRAIILYDTIILGMSQAVLVGESYNGIISDPIIIV